MLQNSREKPVMQFPSTKDRKLLMKSSQPDFRPCRACLHPSDFSHRDKVAHFTPETLK